jgi:galactonate dehydratase
MNDRVRAYTYLYPEPHHDPDRFWIDPDMAGEAAAARVAEGWTAVKFDPAGPYTIRGGHMPGRRDIALSAAFCAAIRAAVGDAADLLFGTHGQFIPGGAIRLAKAIEPSDPLWFEEPVPPDDFPALAEVARATSIPVATGERLSTKAEFAPRWPMARASCNRRWAGQAGSGRPRRSPSWPRPRARRWRRIFMPGRWNGRRTCIWR